MVNLMGHIAMGLLWALPAWYLWDGRISVAFSAFVVSMVMLPDIDLLLRTVIPAVEHHGITHTVLFVSVIAGIVGMLTARHIAPLIERWWLKSENEVISRRSVYFFVSGGMLLGGLSHIFADMLSAPDIAPPPKPLWPVIADPLSFDVLYYSSIWWNVGLLVLAGTLHLYLAFADTVSFSPFYRRT